MTGEQEEREVGDDEVEVKEQRDLGDGEVERDVPKEQRELDSGEAEPKKQDVFFKTSLCSYFRKSGSCRHALECRYAHGEDELRPRPDGTWDPTSLRGRPAQKPESEPPTEEEQEEEEGENGEDSLRKCIRDLPLRWTSEDLNKLLADKGLVFRPSRKRKRSPVGFVDFECDEHAILAKEKLDGLLIQSKALKVVNGSPRCWEKKNTQQVSGEGERLDGSSVATCMDICDVVTPLAKLPYDEQLGRKKAEISQVLKKLVRNVRKAISSDVPLPEWVMNARLQGGLCCTFDGIVASPVVDGYRNKCEFTIGHSLDGKRVVGFLLGNFREGRSTVMEPDKCQNVSLNARMYAKAFQNFVQDSELPLWDKATNAGFWRLFTVREGRAASRVSSVAEIMLIVQVCSLGVEESIKSKEFNRMAHTLALFAFESHLPFSALLIQDHLGISNAASPDAPLIPLAIPQLEGGSMETDMEPRSFIHDYICNLRFRISPTAFFQVNTMAAEKLYNMAGDWAELDSRTLLFDVCCGTGTIGLTLAHRVGLVIGIEMNASAVADACTNAEINGIENCRFVCGKAEDVMHGLLEQYILKDEDFSAETLTESKESPGLVLSSEEECVKKDVGVSGVPKAETSAEASTKSNDLPCSVLSAGGGVKKKSGAPEGKFNSIVVLVDPPRSGLHPVVLKLLRTHEDIHRLVYVSCNPETLLANAVELCTPSGTGDHGKGAGQRGPWRKTVVSHARQRVKSMPVSIPFSPVKAVAVDMFPHTPHCEVIMLMQR